MGWGRSQDERLLVHEYIPGGDLNVRPHDCKQGRRIFLWDERLAIVVQVASGLAYLHNSTPHAFHRDVKPENIFLTSGGAKFGDFGLACIARSRRADSAQCDDGAGTRG